MKLSQQTILQWMKAKINRPMKFSELAKCLSIPDAQRREFRHLIKLMVSKGTVIKIRGGRYSLLDKINIITGTLQGNPNGSGFLTPDDPEEQDIYIAPRNMAGAMHLDRIMVRVALRKKFERYYRVEGVQRSFKNVTDKISALR